LLKAAFLLQAPNGQPGIAMRTVVPKEGDLITERTGHCKGLPTSRARFPALHDGRAAPRAS